MIRHTSFALAMLLAFASSVVAQTASQNKQSSAKTDNVQKADLGKTRNAHVVGDIFLSGQFTPEDLALIQSKGIKSVISLRRPSELEWDEKKLVEDLDLEFKSIPFAQPDSLTDDVFDQVCVLLKGSDGKTLLHCGSASRVGGVWIAHRVLNDNVSLEQARAEAKKIGLRSEAYEAKAIDYVKRKLADKKPIPLARSISGEESVKPGINTQFLDPKLDPEDLIKRFEVESREIFHSRDSIVRACGIKPGDRIADIGAGTGLFTREFAKLTSPEGWVYAVDISSRLIEHINREASTLKLENVTGVLCREDSVCLAPDSVDVAFICDTYHHFEFPKSTMTSLHRALSKNGKLVVIDFERIPGKTRPWLLGHVRADKQTFRQEIESAGFEFVQELELAGLSENYFLIFQKK